MTDTQIVELGLQAMTIAAKMCAPVLHHGAVDRFRDLAVPVRHPDPGSHASFVPKAAGVGAAILFSGNWMLHEMVTYTTQLFEKIPTLIG